jgi:hypothetical protein
MDDDYDLDKHLTSRPEIESLTLQGKQLSPANESYYAHEDN